jgi:uncharacterized protein YdeI (YjbR/CyaY-like superfamily)
MKEEINEFVSRQKKWGQEVQKLREIALGCELNESLKWKTPCFDFNESNVALIGCFKEYCSLSFFKGVLLSDSENLLVSPGANSQSVRYLKFSSLEEIITLESVIKHYLFEAIEIEKLGLKVELKKSTEIVFVEELAEKMKKDNEFESAFLNLTPGRQRGYNLFFEGAKQSQTRISRIEKYESRILDGKGMNDCVCGLSKKMPGCDGSHKYSIS